MTDANAPIVYFDEAPAFGALHGAIQVELAANLLHTDGTGSVSVSRSCTGRLRCSPNAAALLIHALTQALELANAKAPTKGVN